MIMQNIEQKFYKATPRLTCVGIPNISKDWILCLTMSGKLLTELFLNGRAYQLFRGHNQTVMLQWILIVNKEKAGRDAGFCSNRLGEGYMKKSFSNYFRLVLLGACGQKKKIEKQENTSDSSKSTLDKEQKSA